jgi:hypothetical protein
MDIVKNTWMLTSIYTKRLKVVISYSPLEVATTCNVASHLAVTTIRILFNISSIAQVLYYRITVNGVGRILSRVVAYYNHHICLETRKIIGGFHPFYRPRRPLGRVEV